MIIGAARATQFVWDQIPQLTANAAGTTLWIAQFSVMTGPISLAICCLAMLLRSGAVVWLLGMQFLFTSTPMLIAAWTPTGSFALLATLVGIAFAIGAAILSYLVLKQELRAP
ncbi:hypothetical protein [Yoonia sp. SS1-5]|uniref:Uncharacterized protein n=1 Tax=Yoonia rhodophyticola TaxID=3137370 RepID=A0AAN0M9T7_9RHOB